MSGAGATLCRMGADEPTGGSDGDRRGAVICASTPELTALAVHEAERAGFEVEGVNDHPDGARRLIELVQPALVVLEHELGVGSGLVALPELHAALDGGEILFVSWDRDIRDQAVEAGAFGVVYKSDLDELPGALGRLVAWLEGAADRPPGERRSGVDRRRRQDWQQVTRERRSGVDRRSPDGSEPSS